MNHHIMEGLKFPSDNKEDLVALLIDSDLYNPRIKKRFEITKEVFTKNGIQTETLKLNSNSKLSQAFEVIQYGAYTAFYIAMINGLDPAPILWVDYFKERLK